MCVRVHVSACVCVCVCVCACVCVRWGGGGHQFVREQMLGIKATPATTPAGIMGDIKPGNDRAALAVADDGESEEDGDDSGMSDVVRAPAKPQACPNVYDVHSNDTHTPLQQLVQGMVEGSQPRARRVHDVGVGCPRSLLVLSHPRPRPPFIRTTPPSVITPRCLQTRRMPYSVSWTSVLHATPVRTTAVNT